MYYNKYIDYQPELTKERELELIQNYQRNKDEESLKELTISHLKFIFSVANQFRSKGVMFEDLVQEGIIGLFLAIQYFDEAKGFRLLTTAGLAIRQRMIKITSKNISIVRRGTNTRERKILKNRKKVETEILAENKELRDEDIAERLGVPFEEFLTMKNYGNDLSLDYVIKSDKDTDVTLLDTLESEEDVEYDIIRNAIIQDVQQLIHITTEKLVGTKKTFFEERFLSVKEKPVSQIADELGISYYKAKKMEEELFDMLKENLHKTNITEDSLHIK